MLAGYKTYITAAVAVIGAVAAYLTGEATIAVSVQTIITALLAVFLRNGMAPK
jgi:hypothetical protein